MNPAPPNNILSRYAPPPAIAGVLAMLCWAGSIILVKDVAGTVPPAALSFLRCVTALLILYPICRKTLHSQWPIMRRHWKFIALQGVLLFIGGNGLLFVGLQFTTAINGALLNSAEPVTIVAVAWIMFRDRLTPIQWLGVAISLVGVLYLIGQGNLEILLGLKPNIGDIFILFSILTWALYAVFMRLVPPELDRLNLLFGILLAGMVALFPFWILENIYYMPTPIIWTTAWATGFNATFASIFALFWWNHAVEGLGPARAGLLLHLIPVFTVLLAIGLIGEELHLFHGIGICLIAVGIYLTTVLKTKKENTV